MLLEDKIIQDLKEAMKAKDELRISCLRMLKTSLKNKQVEKRNKLKDEEIQAVISSLIRKDREASKEFREGGRSANSPMDLGKIMNKNLVSKMKLLLRWKGFFHLFSTGSLFVPQDKANGPELVS